MLRAFPGAGGKLRALKERMADVKTEIHGLKAAHRQSVDLDAFAAATAARDARRSQFVTVQTCGRRPLQSHGRFLRRLERRVRSLCSVR